MDYYKFGQRIRKLRKARGLSQENLAEMLDISVTHMSHIETANTKMSFSLIIKIAEILDVSLDYLVYDKDRNENSFSQQIAEITSNCSDKDKRIILDTVKAMVDSFEINNSNN